MKKDVIISEEANAEYTIVTIKKLFDNQTTQYKYKNAEKYESPYLSLENLSYHISLRNEDETDDYLLNHALQENKKLCVSFFTNNPEVVENVFNDHERYSVLIRETGKPELSKLVVVSRKGCLKDYFDIDDIVDWYERQGISFLPEDEQNILLEVIKKVGNEKISLSQAKELHQMCLLQNINIQVARPKRTMLHVQKGQSCIIDS